MSGTERAELACYPHVYATEMEKSYGRTIINTRGYHKSNASIGDAPGVFGGSVPGIAVKDLAADTVIGMGVNSGVQLTGNILSAITIHRTNTGSEKFTL